MKVGVGHMNRIDWNLLVLAAAEGKSLTPAQYQKVLFMLQRSCPWAITEGYSFRPYNYGPFDADVYNDGEQLEHQGLVQINRSGGGWRTYSATLAGLAKARELESLAEPHALDYARNVVAWARSLSFRDLVTKVYTEYPEMRVNSIFKD